MYPQNRHPVSQWNDEKEFPEDVEGSVADRYTAPQQPRKTNTLPGNYEWIPQEDMKTIYLSLAMCNITQSPSRSRPEGVEL
jgi:hypothetical protein